MDSLGRKVLARKIQQGNGDTNVLKLIIQAKLSNNNKNVFIKGNKSNEFFKRQNPKSHMLILKSN